MRATRRFDSMLETAGVAALLIKAEQRFQIAVTDRPPEGLAPQARSGCVWRRRFHPRRGGWHTKIFLRLGVSPGPVGFIGPVIATVVTPALSAIDAVHVVLTRGIVLPASRRRSCAARRSV